MNISEILKDLEAGKITAAEAEKKIRFQPIIDLGYAKLDGAREIRQGFPETVFCQGKDDKFIVDIFKTLLEKNGRVLGTRATEHQYELVKAELPDCNYDSLSKVLTVIRNEIELIGNICVISAGTADMFVSEEAAKVAEFFGCKVNRCYDCGVSGIHRLLSKVEELDEANAVIAVAGMEGALASVVAGLVRVPVIAVPTSVGYGASFEGLSALLTMINSCANGVCVVNIDNGYGAGYLASQINKIANQV